MFNFGKPTRIERLMLMVDGWRLSDVDYTVGPCRFIFGLSCFIFWMRLIYHSKRWILPKNRREGMNRGAIRMTNSYCKNKTDLMEASRQTSRKTMDHLFRIQHVTAQTLVANLPWPFSGSYMCKLLHVNTCRMSSIHINNNHLTNNPYNLFAGGTFRTADQSTGYPEVLFLLAVVEAPSAWIGSAVVLFSGKSTGNESG